MPNVPAICMVCIVTPGTFWSITYFNKINMHKFNKKLKKIKLKRKNSI